jgi:hypothetical protein
MIGAHGRSVAGTAREMTEGSQTTLGQSWLTSDELADELAKIVALIDHLERRSDDPARQLLGALRLEVTSKRAEILARIRRWEEEHSSQNGE